MDKPKQPQGPRPRAKRVLPPPGDFIALGKSTSAKPRLNTEGDAKASQVNPRKPSTSSLSAVGQKRKDIGSGSTGAPKQARTFSPSFIQRKDSSSSKLETNESIPSVKLVDAQPSDLEEMVLAAHTKGDQDQIDGLLCGAMKTLKLNRLKPDPMLYLTLLNLAKEKPTLFTTKRVLEHFLQFLRRDTSGSVVKPKPNTLLCILTCNILLHAFQNEESWPQSFMKVYIEDSLGDRSWVDNEHNKEFVNNIVCVFGTKLPSNIASQSCNTAKSGLLDPAAGGLVSLPGTKSKEIKDGKEGEISLEATEQSGVQNRYPSNKDEEMIQTYIQDMLKEQLNKRQMIDSVSRNVLRFLTAVCGYAEVRLLASQRLEAWLQNPKLTRPAQELLLSVALNCNSHSADDIDVIANLVRMRLKAKPVANQYVNCIRELLSQHPNNLGTTLKHVIYNELSQQRNPHNMAILSVIFVYDPEAAAKYLAIVFQDLLCSREDYLRALRALFREIVRSLKYEVNLVEFCRSMMQDRHEAVFLELEQSLKDRMFISVIDLICLGCFLSVSPIVKELSLSLAKGEKRDYSVLQAFQSQISVIQTDAVWFFHTKVIPMYSCSEKEFVVGLQRILFLESNEQYSNKDNWPPENERNILLQLVREVPLAEDALLRLHLLGLGEDIFINHADTLDVTEKMILRATVLRTGLNGLEIERTEVLQMLLSLSAYSHPKDIQLPTGYTPPDLAISALYWKAWLMMLVLAATNPTTLGLTVWETYPTARCMMEMLITGCYQFPPLACGDATPDEIRANELQIDRAEKNDIVEFEGHLAAATSGATICENTSLLISQLMNLDPSGPPRQPPTHVIDRLKLINETYGLGKMLCHSREPDFLLSIIQSQGSNRSMPWLADLVQSSESSLNALPIQCLCEFLLMKQNLTETELYHSHSKQRSIRYKVASRLHDLLMGSEATAESSNKLVKYFIQRWSSSEMKDREASVNGFKSILLLPRSKRGSTSSFSDPMEVDETSSWLHGKMSTLPYFDEVMPDILIAIRESLIVEVDVLRMREYIQFLSYYYQKESPQFIQVLVENLSQLLTCRRTVSQKMIDINSPDGLTTYKYLLDIFATYISSELRPANVELTKKDRINKVKVCWSKDSLHSEKYLVVHLKVVHACIVLLTYASTSQKNDQCDFLLRTWFLDEGSYKMIDTCTNAELELYEEWLRVMMIQSSHKQLVQAGLEGCTPTQLIKFLQASGISAANQSYLLQLLDVCAENKPDELVNLIMDTDHFIQLVELCQSRGAEGGERFCKLLDPDYEKENDILTLEEIAMDLSLNEETRKKPKPRSSQPLLSSEMLKNTLEQTFKSDKEKGKRNSDQSFFLLKQRLSISAMSKTAQKIDVADMFVGTLLKLCEKEDFLKAFSSHKEAVSLLQLLSCTQQSNEAFQDLILKLKDCKTKSNPIEKVISSISERLGMRDTVSTSKKCVKKLLDTLVSSKGNSKDSSNNLELFIEQLKECDIEELDKGKLVQACLLVSKSSKFNFEYLIKTLCTNVKRPETVNYLVDILVQVIQSIDNPFGGLLIDWLSILDPEIMKLNPNLQRQFLFSQRNAGTSIPVGRTSTAYMTSMLAHQTKNSTLEECFVWILSHVKDTESLKASNSLDFLTAMMNNPRLWQGRENRQETEKQELQNKYNNEGHIMVDLTVHQLYSLIRLILTELEQSMKGPNDVLEKSVTEVMDKRLSLLLNLSRKSTKNLHKAIKFVRQFNKSPRKVLDCFLRHLYSRRPLLVPDIMKLASPRSNELCIPQEAQTPIDKLIHRLILSICEPNGTQAWEEKFKCVTAMNRRLAVNHPHAFLRHLPLLLSMLVGKSRLSSGVFKLTNQLLYCTHVFGLFDILRPHVFREDEQSENTTAMFVEVFMELIQSTCLKPDQCAGFVNKMVEYLNSCIGSGTKWVGRVLKKHEYTFKELMYDFPNFEGLPFITTFISAYDVKSDIQPSLLSTHFTPFNEVQLTSFQQRLSPNHHIKDLLNVLADLDETSKRRIDILKHFLKELSSLTSSIDAEVREKAHVLLLRHHKYQPRNSHELVNLYLDHLTSSTDVMESTAKYSPQVVLLSDYKCDMLLKRLFDKAISTHSEISGYIVQSVKNLNIDY